MHNINFVTPEHVVPQVALAILHAKSLGLSAPVVYNTFSFDSLDSLSRGCILRYEIFPSQPMASRRRESS